MTAHGLSLAERFWLHVDRSGNCWVWTASTQVHGYPYGNFTLRHESRILAHRMSFELEFGAIPDGMCVLHRCDNPRCVRPSHLFLGTQADNAADREAKGRGRVPATQRGERHHQARLTAEDAKAIYARAHAGESQRKLAAEYRIGPSVISGIKRRVAWKDATKDLA